MNQAFLLRTLCVLSAYLVLQQFISFFVFFEQRHTAYTILVICAVSAFLCCCLRNKKFLKFVPLLLLGFSAFFIWDIAEIFLFAPCWLYCIYLVAGDNFEVNHARFQRFFRLCNIAVAILILIALLVSIFNPLNEVIIFGLIYFAFGITLKRAIRHGGIVLQNPFFAFLNLSTSVLFVAAVFFLSYPAMVQALFRIIVGGLYYIFVFPVIAIMQLIMPLLNRIEFGTITTINWFRNPPPMAMAEDPEMGIYRTYVNWLGIFIAEENTQHIFTIVIVILVVFVISLLLFRKRKKLLALLAIDEKPEFTPNSFTSKYAQVTQKSRLSQLLDTNYIRRYYRRFLKLCVNKGMVLGKDSTTATIARDAKEFISDEANIDQLREVYIKSRYSGKEDTKEDKAKAKETYLRIKRGLQS